MKRELNFKKTILGLSLAIAIIPGIISCNSNKNHEDSKGIAEEHNEAKFNMSKEYDAEFLVKAAEINLEEIKLGQLAEDKGGTNAVKELGKMMKDQHTKKQSELESLATKKTITIPSSISDEGQKAYNKLSEKMGADFDKEYCDMMVDGHKDAIKRFEKASTECNDADIRNWATETLPGLRMHLDHAMDCQKKNEKM